MTQTGGNTVAPRDLGTGLWVGSTDALIVGARLGDGPVPVSGGRWRG